MRFFKAAMWRIMGFRHSKCFVQIKKVLFTRKILITLINKLNGSWDFRSLHSPPHFFHLSFARSPPAHPPLLRLSRPPPRIPLPPSARLVLHSSLVLQLAPGLIPYTFANKALVLLPLSFSACGLVVPAASLRSFIFPLFLSHHRWSLIPRVGREKIVVLILTRRRVVDPALVAHATGQCITGSI